MVTTAIIAGPRNAAIAGPNGAVIVGPNYATPFEDYTQGLNVVISGNSNASFGLAEAAWVKANASTATFTRDVINQNRAYFTNAAAPPRATLYSNFTTATFKELEAWSLPVSQGGYGEAAINALKMLAPDGSYYDNINPGKNGAETMMDFTNLDWIALRLSSIPEYNSNDKLGNHANIDALQMDLCPLYPVPNLLGGKDNPFGTAALWKAAMLTGISYVRDRIDNDIHLFINGLRQYSFEIIPDFLDNPATYEGYDGRDLLEPGHYGSAAGIELGLDYNVGDRNKMLFGLRALYRASNQGFCVGATMKVDTSPEGGVVAEEENQHRINNLVVYSLIHEADYTRFTNRPGESFAPYPARIFPEMDIVLGAPNEAVASMFTGYDDAVAQLFVRTFANGYTALYNWSNETVAVPETYQTAYQQIRPRVETALNKDGTTDAAVEYAPVGATLGPWDGMLLTQQGSTLTVTTGDLAQLVGEVNLFFGVGPTGMMIDTGEFIGGPGSTEVSATLDIQDGDQWEVSVQGKDQPGIRDNRQAMDFVPIASGQQITGTGGRGRWIRVILRALAPLLHRLGASEVDVRQEER